jgi:hypothetical protein
MSQALRHPALQAAAGVGAFLALTWPLLVFNRPIHVVIGFFAIWIAVIGLLAMFSRAHETPEGDAGNDLAEEDGDVGGD